MSQFKPLTVRFSNGSSLRVSSLLDASKALDQLGWANDDDPQLLRAAKLIDDAMHGRCAPKVAFDMFAGAAFRQGMVELLPRSKAWAEFEAAMRHERNRY